MTNLERIGKVCQSYRLSISRTQAEVAGETGYSIENISAFERGLNDNYRILIWYIAHGLTIEHIKRGLEDG